MKEKKSDKVWDLINMVYIILCMIMGIVYWVKGDAKFMYILPVYMLGVGIPWIVDKIRDLSRRVDFYTDLLTMYMKDQLEKEGTKDE